MTDENATTLERPEDRTEESVTFTIDRRGPSTPTRIAKSLRFVVVIGDELLEGCSGESLAWLDEIDKHEKASRKLEMVSNFLDAEGY